MQLVVMRHLWGVTESWEVAFPRFREAGYAGIETRAPEPEDRERFRQLLAEHDFQYIQQVHTAGSTVAEHVASFRKQVEAGRELTPRLIGVQGGRDAWNDEESVRFFEQVLEIEQEIGIPVGHETHRGRILFNPWVTSRMLDRFPDLKLVCDLSHWTLVGERMLADQGDVIRQAAERCIHLHARVGYEEGPQVPDPRAPEFAHCLDAFEAWWRMIWEIQRERGLAESTVTPEYGPPGYLHTLPYTRQPVANLAEVCDWQAQRVREIFAG